ncbi:hypothetical protein S7711_07938 [Stachybotrys chartarum IBT 7711]|uniref:Uncharacterized protein n=1 Tax=Stachybotrys chartarum (strain CBS 109288 / IBT 7711) TaxID=1280523 RepID=A0A084AKS8_STACB|nr:hypothetical protein S7711_07938 [Stachybotrys chartarum IBT 7711]KFA55796.1 hypothetical protein S40293_01877 [Stachybotrys chartarum IBT 40293]
MSLPPLDNEVQGSPIPSQPSGNGYSNINDDFSSFDNTNSGFDNFPSIGTTNLGDLGSNGPGFPLQNPSASYASGGLTTPSHRQPSVSYQNNGNTRLAGAGNNGIGFPLITHASGGLIPPNYGQPSVSYLNNGMVSTDQTSSVAPGLLFQGNQGSGGPVASTTGQHHIQHLDNGYGFPNSNLLDSRLNIHPRARLNMAPPQVIQTGGGYRVPLIPNGQQRSNVTANYVNSSQMPASSNSYLPYGKQQPLPAAVPAGSYMPMDGTQFYNTHRPSMLPTWYVPNHTFTPAPSNPGHGSVDPNVIPIQQGTLATPSANHQGVLLHGSRTSGIPNGALQYQQGVVRNQSVSRAKPVSSSSSQPAAQRPVQSSRQAPEKNNQRSHHVKLGTPDTRGWEFHHAAKVKVLGKDGTSKHPADVTAEEAYPLPPQKLESWSPPGSGEIRYQYTIQGQLENAIKLDKEDLEKYLRHCPREPKIWVQRPPSQPKGREDRLDKICRWVHCPVPSRLISMPFFRVAFDEFHKETSTGHRNPYKYAMCMHLWCFEQMLDVVPLHNQRTLYADTRDPPPLERVHPMSIDNEHGFEDIYLPWFKDHQRQQGDPPPQIPRPHVESLGYALTNHHITHQPKARQETRNKRNMNKSEDTRKTLDRHRGDLAMYCGKVKNGKEAKVRERARTKTRTRTTVQSSEAAAAADTVATADVGTQPVLHLHGATTSTQGQTEFVAPPPSEYFNPLSQPAVRVDGATTSTQGQTQEAATSTQGQTQDASPPLEEYFNPLGGSKKVRNSTEATVQPGVSSTEAGAGASATASQILAQENAEYARMLTSAMEDSSSETVGGSDLPGQLPEVDGTAHVEVESSSPTRTSDAAQTSPAAQGSTDISEPIDHHEEGPDLMSAASGERVGEAADVNSLFSSDERDGPNDIGDTEINPSLAEAVTAHEHRQEASGAAQPTDPADTTMAGGDEAAAGPEAVGQENTERDSLPMLGSQEFWDSLPTTWSDPAEEAFFEDAMAVIDNQHVEFEDGEQGEETIVVATPPAQPTLKRCRSRSPPPAVKRRKQF